ncbi:hypothetical protein [Eikenella sp. NML01-A-086]|uniref:hypothetical protein n=1 Tax=Eikenella sp. NML01-A-086 TaxID=1795826 RepID=UPI0007DFCD5A|nr:hypothetical protein [Eikenella sp. NML01-A-086]OAM28830.1 hypothetical protein A7P94_02110 [Eikenella sp. NML01-A-086]
MAEIQADESDRHKRCPLIGWNVVTVVLTLTFALIPRFYAPDKDGISCRIVEACPKYTRRTAMASQLGQNGLAGQSERVLEPYCCCLWEESVQKLSTEDLRSLPKLSPKQQLDKLGGSEVFLQRQEQCLVVHTGR